MNLRGKFVSVTFVGQCESAGVHKNRGLLDELVDLPVGGFGLALKAGFSALGCSRLIQIKTRDHFPEPYSWFLCTQGWKLTQERT